MGMHVVDDVAMQELLAFVADYQAFIRNRQILIDVLADAMRLIDQMKHTAPGRACPHAVFPEHAPTEEERRKGAPSPKSVVSVTTFTDGHADITVTGESGTLTLETQSGEDPLIAIEDPDRGPYRTKAAASLVGNGNLRGWFVEKKGSGRGNDTLVWFPATKKRARKRAPKRARASQPAGEA